MSLLLLLLPAHGRQGLLAAGPVVELEHRRPFRGGPVVGAPCGRGPRVDGSGGSAARMLHLGVSMLSSLLVTESNRQGGCRKVYGQSYMMFAVCALYANVNRTHALSGKPWQARSLPY